MLTRRHALIMALAAPAILRFGIGTAQAETILKISHQFPGGTIDRGDFRDRLCRMFAAEVAKRSGGELPETNIGLMPGLVSTYDQGLRWKGLPVGKLLTDFLADKGIIMLTWIWQAGGVASRAKPVVAPEDVKGLKGRGGSREMDMVLRTAGAEVL